MGGDAIRAVSRFDCQSRTSLQTIGIKLHAVSDAHATYAVATTCSFCRALEACRQSSQHMMNFQDFPDLRLVPGCSFANSARSGQSSKLQLSQQLLRLSSCWLSWSLLDCPDLAELANTRSKVPKWRFAAGTCRPRSCTPPGLTS